MKNEFVIKNGVLTMYDGHDEIVTIPDSVFFIGSCAFYGRTGLKSVTIPDSVTSIGSAAFRRCTGLTSVKIGNGVTSIGFNALSGCRSLKSVTIPNSVTSIGVEAFYGCAGLKSVTIGDGVTKIGENAFRDCTRLKSAKANYKAFRLADGKMHCINMEYRIGEWNECAGDLVLCQNGLHYCTNLYEVFNYYFGLLDKDIAICLCEVDGEVRTLSDTSKHCARRLMPVRRLSREEIIHILNGGKPPKVD